jgi:hypothetical protein
MSEYINDKGQTIYQTENGKQVILNSISPLFIAKLQSAGTLPEIPTRQVKLDLDGFEPTFQIERLSAEDLQDAEEQEKWRVYEEERDAVLAKRNTGFMKAIFAKGVTVDLTHLDEWKEEQVYYGLEVPLHPTDLKVEYIQTEVVESAEDMVGIITGVLGKSGIPQEELEAVRSQFRNSIRRSTTRQVDTAKGEVGVERELYPDESGSLLEGVASEQVLRGEY